MTNPTKTNQNPTMVDAMYDSKMGKMDWDQQDDVWNGLELVLNE